MPARALLLALLGSSPALAQDLTVHDAWLLEPVPGSYYENGIGSPTVAYDRAHDTWVMYFETQIGPADPVGCKTGVWGLGRATSPDGLAWTIDEQLVLEPVVDTYYGCTIAHPEVVYDGTRWRLWFKAEQPSNACDDGGVAPPWGCRAITGVGYAESTDGLDWVIDPEPILDIASFGFPTVAKVDGTWRMLLAYSNASNNTYELWESVSLDDGVTWSLPEVVVRPGFADWVQDEIYNPALTCRNDAPFAFVLWTGGRDTTQTPEGRTINTAGLGRAFSENGIEWPWDAANPYVQWNLDPEAGPVDKDWRHWDSVRIGDDYLIFFTQKDDAGHNRVGLAYTYAGQQTSFQDRRISDRICSTPEEQDTAAPDTDATSDSDADTDATRHTDGSTDTASDSDAHGTDADGGKHCGCDTSAPAGVAQAAALLALGLRRRRRRA